jgi:hypothetical protein
MYTKEGVLCCSNGVSVFGGVSTYPEGVSTYPEGVSTYPEGVSTYPRGVNVSEGCQRIRSQRTPYPRRKNNERLSWH